MSAVKSCGSRTSRHRADASFTGTAPARLPAGEGRPATHVSRPDECDSAALCVLCSAGGRGADGGAAQCPTGYTRLRCERTSYQYLPVLI